MARQKKQDPGAVFPGRIVRSEYGPDVRRGNALVSSLDGLIFALRESWGQDAAHGQRGIQDVAWRAKVILDLTTIILDEMKSAESE